jgi:hypothetical protein
LVQPITPSRTNGSSTFYPTELTTPCRILSLVQQPLYAVLPKHSEHHLRSRIASVVTATVEAPELAVGVQKKTMCTFVRMLLPTGVAQVQRDASCTTRDTGMEWIANNTVRFEAGFSSVRLGATHAVRWVLGKMQLCIAHKKRNEGYNPPIPPPKRQQQPATEQVHPEAAALAMVPVRIPVMTMMLRST